MRTIYSTRSTWTCFVCVCVSVSTDVVHTCTYMCIYIQDKKHADMLKKQHHTMIGNVRMEAKPCVPPRCAVFLAPPPFSPFPCPSSPTSLPVVNAGPFMKIFPCNHFINIK